MRPAILTAFRKAKAMTVWAVPLAMAGLLAGSVDNTPPNDLEFNGTADAVAAVPLNPPKFGPFTEDEAQRRGAPQIADLNTLRHVPTNNALDQLATNHAKLVRNRTEFDQVLRDCAREVAQPCAPGLQKYQAMLTEVREMRAPYLQAMVINAWVNSSIRYDNEEVGTNKRRNLDEALIVGKGVCDEQAQLKLHALQAVGFKSDDTRYVVGNVVQNGKFKIAHAVATVRIDGRALVLNNQLSAQMPAQAASFQAISKLMDGTSRLMATPELHGDKPEERSAAEKFLPVYAMNYQTAAPYIGMNSNTQAPFYVGRRLKHQRKIEISDVSLGVGLSKISPSFRPSVSTLLIDAFNLTKPKPEAAPVAPNVAASGTLTSAPALKP
jgi:predicted transglutaminase-like cysteine proteinase